MNNDAYVKKLEAYVEKLELELALARQDKWIAEQELLKAHRRDPLPVYKQKQYSCPKVTVMESA